MALQWSPKAAADVVERVWTPKAGESVSSKTVTVSTGTATITSAIQGEDVVVTVTGGTADITQILAASAVLGNGETITETIYLPVLATPNDLAYTGQDIVSDVLELVVGIGGTTDASEQDLGLRKMTDMLASWRSQGADLGVVLPVTSSTVFYISDAFAEGVKANLYLRVMPKFQQGWMPTPDERDAARRGLQLIKSALLPKEREGASYF